MRVWRWCVIAVVNTEEVGIRICCYIKNNLNCGYISPVCIHDLNITFLGLGITWESLTIQYVIIIHMWFTHWFRQVLYCLAVLINGSKRDQIHQEKGWEHWSSYWIYTKHPWDTKHQKVSSPYSKDFVISDVEWFERHKINKKCVCCEYRPLWH